MDDGTIIPEEQSIPDWCILCPRNRYLKDHSFAHIHYLCMHHKKLLVVNNSKMLACKCSEIRSHGSDRSAKTSTSIAVFVFIHLKAGDLLATHMITSHTEIDLSQVHHLMHENNLCRPESTFHAPYKVMIRVQSLALFARAHIG